MTEAPDAGQGEPAPTEAGTAEQPRHPGGVADPFGPEVPTAPSV